MSGLVECRVQLLPERHPENSFQHPLCGTALIERQHPVIEQVGRGHRVLRGSYNLANATLAYLSVNVCGEIRAVPTVAHVPPSCLASGEAVAARHELRFEHLDPFMS
jgi:hypothetical protein